jgi:hypothetical protein
MTINLASSKSIEISKKYFYPSKNSIQTLVINTRAVCTIWEKLIKKIKITNEIRKTNMLYLFILLKVKFNFIFYKKIALDIKSKAIWEELL